MIKIVHDKKAINCYKRIAELKKTKIEQILFNENIFDVAGEKFRQGCDLLKAVTKSEDIYFIKVQDRITDCAGSSIEVNINANVQNFVQNTNIDLSLLEKFNVFVFEELEEYTYKIARLLINRNCNKIIYFMDYRAEYFFESKNITIITSLEDVEVKNTSKIMYVSSFEHMNFKFGVLFCHTYSSIQVMSSLCWVCNVRHPGNRKETVLLINTTFDEGCGLGFIIRTVSALRILAQERGWLVAVRILGNMYTDSMDINMWEQYFEQDEKYDCRMLKECENVIDLSENHFSQLAIYYNPHFMQAWQDVEKHVKPRLKQEIIEQFEDRLKSLKDNNSRTLGVLIRGTDASEKASEISSIYYMISECMEEMELGKFDYIFLATEDKFVLENFKIKFRKKLLYVDQKRVSMDEGNKKLVGKLLDIPPGEKEQFGKEYLYITYCLSMCNALMFNMQSGGYYLTKLWQTGKFEYEKQLKYTLSETEKLYEICQMLQQNKKCVVYGTGNICSKILKFLGKLGESIEFCDAKAEKITYEYKEKKVMSPNELLIKYKEGRVCCIVIASLLYADEIKESLINKGRVRMQDIIIFRDNEGIL